VPRGFPRPGSRALTAAAGSLDAAANVLYLLATREGLLTVVAVLAALYPVSTIILARVVLHERFARLQRLGLALALPAAILMAL
jgi:drug/metabolite transporter (DMT)-like permease